MEKGAIQVAYYIYYDELETLGPYLYGIRMWSERGYDVSVYSLTEAKRYLDLPEEFRCHFKHYTVRFPFWLKMCCLGLQGVGFIAKKVLNMKTSGGQWAKIPKMGYYALWCYLKTDKNRRCVLIAESPAGLWAAALVSRKNNSPYVYFVKEIFLSEDAKNIFDQFVKYLEIKANKGALYTVEFDETRAEKIRQDNNLQHESMAIVPNAPVGEATEVRGTYFNDMFGIGSNTKIALYVSGIADYTLTYEHIKATEAWSDNVVLVMHVKGSEREMEKLKKYAARFNGKVYLSTKMVPLDEIEKIYGSCDIGFAFYGSEIFNHKYAGLGSGKMFHFMKACVPVITNNSPSCKKAIEENGCGVCIDHISEAGDAIEKILATEDTFKRNCRRMFSSFRYDKNHARLMDKIEGAMGVKRPLHMKGYMEQ